jgi:hypothetical protein
MKKIKYMPVILILISIAIVILLIHLYSIKSNIDRKHHLNALHQKYDTQTTFILIMESLSHSDFEEFKKICDEGRIAEGKFGDYTIFTYIYYCVRSTRSLLNPEGLSGSDLDKWNIKEDETQLQFLKIALEHGADVNILDNINRRGFAPIHYSVTKVALFPRTHEACPEYLNLLFQYGADANLKSRDGDTPLHVALSYYGEIEVLQILIDHGANINAVNAKGKTPLDIAIEENSESEVIQFLRDHGAKQAKDLPCN